ncbi:hypothetical protein F66182_3216 [Fusarium sp. NRRL 66182]|nr:hypothetical protein F66182_3216 [Fusarium sp. NRRL 66182]
MSEEPMLLRIPPEIQRTMTKMSRETTYCADPHPERAMNMAIMHINKKIREEASHFLYTRHAFHFGEDLEAVVPFLADKTPRTRDLVREISLYKRSPTNATEPDSYDWSSALGHENHGMGHKA